VTLYHLAGPDDCLAAPAHRQEMPAETLIVMASEEGDRTWIDTNDYTRRPGLSRSASVATFSPAIRMRSIGMDSAELEHDLCMRDCGDALPKSLSRISKVGRITKVKPGNSDEIFAPN
jgi:hypothetical protein